MTVPVSSTSGNTLTSQHMFFACGKIDCSVNLSMEENSFRPFGDTCQSLFSLTHVIKASHNELAQGNLSRILQENIYVKIHDL